MAQTKLSQFFSKRNINKQSDLETDQPPAKKQCDVETHMEVNVNKHETDSNEQQFSSELENTTRSTDRKSENQTSSNKNCSPRKQISESELSALFPGKKVHHHDLCEHCSHISKDEEIRLRDTNKDRSRHKVFRHAWLSAVDIAYCELSGLWWAAYVETEGLYCILCKKHEAYSKANKSLAFSSTPSVRFRPQTLSEHLKSKTHAEIVELELTQRVSTFEKSVQEKKEKRKQDYRMCDEAFVFPHERGGTSLKGDEP